MSGTRGINIIGSISAYERGIYAKSVTATSGIGVGVDGPISGTTGIHAKSVTGTSGSGIFITDYVQGDVDSSHAVV